VWDRDQEGGASGEEEAGKESRERETRDGNRRRNSSRSTSLFLFPTTPLPHLRSERGVQILGAVQVTLEESLEGVGGRMGRKGGVRWKG